MKNYSQILLIGLITMIILNLGTLGYIIYMNQCPNDRMWGKYGKRMFGSEKLHLNPEQEEKFNRLRELHHSQFIEFKLKIDSLRKSNLELVKTIPFDSVKSNLIASEIGLCHERMEKKSLAHFKSIRALLTPDQLPYFTDFIEELKLRKHPGRMGEMDRKEKGHFRE